MKFVINAFDKLTVNEQRHIIDTVSQMTVLWRIEEDGTRETL